MNYQAVFRVDAGSTIGAGHFMRCLALAAEFDKQNLPVLFIVSRETKVFIQNRSDFSYEYQIANADDEFNSISSAIEDFNVSFIILDGYQFDEAYRFELNAICKRQSTLFIIFDDTNDSGLLYADVVINPVSEAYNMGYELSAPKAKLFVGPPYTLLRPEFTQPKVISSNEFEQRNQCVITFGASDVAGLTLPLMSELLNTNSLAAGNELPDNIMAITGAGYISRALLESLLEGYSGLAAHVHDVPDMAAQMKFARCVVSAAGSTAFELAALGLPSVLVVVADNQLNAAMEHQAKGWCVVVDARHNIDSELTKSRVVEEIVFVLQGLWNNEELLSEMRKKAINSAVYDGAERTVSELLALELSLTDQQNKNKQ